MGIGEIIEKKTLYQDVKDKPKYVENPGDEPPLMKSHTFLAADDTVPGEQTYYVEAWYEYKGKTVRSEKVKAGFFLGDRAEEMEKKAVESIEKQYEEDVIEWMTERNEYQQWTEWKKERNKWLKEMTEKGFFDTHSLGTEYDDYTEFWAQIAIISVGIDEYFEYPEEKISDRDMERLINRLYPQVYDENGEPRAEIRNLLEAKLKNIEEDIRDLYPDEPPKNPENGGSGNGSTGDTEGDSGNGGSSGGGSGGGNSGGSPSGGGSGNGNSGEDKPEEPADTVAPTVKKVNLVSPITGIYTKGQEVKIRVDFDKNVYGTEKRNAITENTAPKLFIKFGDNRRR